MTTTTSDAPPRRLRLLEEALTDRCCTAGDAEATRVNKTLFTEAMTAIVPAGIVWGLVYLVLGAAQSAVMPLGYAALSLVNLAVLFRTRVFRRYQLVQLVLITLLPFVLQLRLGGFVPGSAVVLWSLLGPLIAAVFVPPREVAAWFAGFVGVVVVAGLLDRGLDVTEPLSDGAREVFFVMNLLGPSSIAIAVLVSFGRSRQRLRELEVAYLDQTMVLRQREKLATLGTLAAGVAHELNNPAAAVQRAAEQLRPSLAAVREGADLLAGGAPPAAPADRRSPLEVAKQEEQLEEWLDDRGIERAWELAPLLVEAGHDAGTLATAVAGLDGDRLTGLLGVLAHGSSADELGEGIASAARRISEIVGSLRSYSYVDRGTWQTVDVTEGIESTLVLLRSKLGDTQVERDYESDLPRVEVRGNELNQVWTNIIDNALAASGGRGTLRLRTRRRVDEVEVEVEDDGPGIPSDAVGRVFDPFFTTKEPGEGTGLGLNISHNIVVRVHGGRMEVTSEPGRTVFTVGLPLERPSDRTDGDEPV